jgi:hypothetical protein
VSDIKETFTKRATVKLRFLNSQLRIRFDNTFAPLPTAKRRLQFDRQTEVQANDILPQAVADFCTPAEHEQLKRRQPSAHCVSWEKYF